MLRLHASENLILLILFGLKKMKLRVTMAYMAMLAMALGRIKQKQVELMRSLVAA